MKKTWKILPILASFVMFGITAEGQVEWLSNAPTDQYLCAAHPEQNMLFLAGGQAVYKSFDNGDSWETVYTFDTSFSARFFGMWFRNGQTGFASCSKASKSAGVLTSQAPSSPLLFKTADGGESWQCIDTSHNFTNIQFAGFDTLFALEVNEEALYKSVDGGATWENILDGNELCDYSIVDERIVYALHGTTYLNEGDVTTHPDPIVYKTSDGGVSWITIRPANSSKGPRVMDEIFFYENGKGVILGHDLMITENDFLTYETASAGFPSVPEGWCLQNSTLKNGFQIATSWNPFDMAGGSNIRISRDYGYHSTTTNVINPPYTPFYFSFLCGVYGCEADTSFFIVGLNEIFRVKGHDFPNVGVLEHTALRCQINPNPVNNNLTVSSKDPFYLIEVFDLQGKTIWSHSFDFQNEISIPVSTWETGIYILKINTVNKVFTMKFVKI